MTNSNITVVMVVTREINTLTVICAILKWGQTPIADNLHPTGKCV